MNTHSPTKSAHTSSKRRNLVFGSSVPNPFLAQPSPSKSATSRTSYNEWLKSENKFENSQDKGCPAPRNETNMNRRGVGVIEKTPTREARGRSLDPSTAASKGRHISQSRRNISDKIEALYRAKSLECRAENVRVPQVATKPLSLNSIDNGREDGKSRVNIEHGRSFTNRTSKVAEMKRIFDGDLQPESQASGAAVLPSKTPTTNFSRKIKVDRGVVEPTLAPHPPPPPQPMPEFSGKRTSGISPKTILDPAPIIEQNDPTCIAQASITSQRSLAVGRPRGKSKVIEDRIKLFEDVREKKDRAKTRKKERSFSGMIGNSLISMRRSFFELSSWKKLEVQEKKRGLSAKEIQSIVDEFQDGTNDGQIGKRKTIVGRWNAIPQRQPTRITDENAGSFRSSLSSEAEMVVKKAQCGLREPKPRRAAETKSMMLLCREKDGNTAGKQKGVSEKL
jgi:hypothetical protein